MTERPSAPPPNRRRASTVPPAPPGRAAPARGSKPEPVAAAPAPKNERVRPATPSSHESPAPPATSVSVRPPRPPPSGGPPTGARPARPISRHLRALQLLAGAAVVLIASTAVAWGARRYIVSSPRFAVRTVLVDGAQRRSAEQIASSGGIEVGKNIFTLDLELASASISTDPWIEKATVTRTLPSTVHVSVVEREAQALVAIGGDLYLATRDGELFKELAEDDPFDLPIVTGITGEQVARDRAGVIIAVRRLLDVVEDMERAGVARRYPIQELHVERDGSVVITIGKEGIALHLGQPPYRDKVGQAARVLTELAQRKASASVIFLDNDAHPERVVVRMR
ncbi:MULTISPECIES: cell division protein FtsQ/DivIB [Sorangium]|uniref:Cell division protein FtsQ n=1 Tax=Sorangium cellulosum TaxID=56 RepID=A0A4P2QK80_SORCE|nr:MULTISPECIES: FtsQ-type POTRA domain-containing protein [Sorangium]AUX30081.1 cell division protein [Sorangium cellulosum]WCQ89472.1 Cell division protein FtsQ [Sorangium sp. Soce836]